MQVGGGVSFSRAFTGCETAGLAFTGCETAGKGFMPPDLHVSLESRLSGRGRDSSGNRDALGLREWPVLAPRKPGDFAVLRQLCKPVRNLLRTARL